MKIRCTLGLLALATICQAEPNLISFSHSDAESTPVPLLKREIMRQAYILAQDTGTNTICRDTEIGDPALTNATKQLTTVTQLLDTDEISIAVLNGTSTVWNAQFESSSYPDLLAEAVQQTHADQAKPNVQKATGSLNLNLLNSGSITDLFHLLREAHAAHEQGASSESYEALIRGYANLGARSEHLWNVAYKCFQARSLIYAQNLVHAEPENATALFLRAYALGLCGLHADALNDIKVGKKQNTPTPDYLHPLELMLHFKTEALVELANSDSPLAPNAALMALQTLDRTPFKSQLFETCARIGNMTPVDIRMLAPQNDRGGVGSLHRTTIDGFDQMSYWISKEVLPNHPLLPKRISIPLSNQMASTQKSISFWNIFTGGGGGGGGRGSINHPELDYIRQLNLLLCSDAEIALDTDTPSLASFSNLMRENLFFVIVWRQHFMNHWWSVDIDEYTEQVLPYIEGHPLSDLLKSASVNRHGSAKERKQLLQQLKIPTLSPGAKICSTAFYRGEAPSVIAMAKEISVRIRTGLDDTHAELQQEYTFAQKDDKLENPELLLQAESILKCSPNSPYGFRQTLNRAADWEERFKAFPIETDMPPEISQIIAYKYRNDKQYEKAIPYYEAALKKIPNELYLYEHLAKCYKAMDHEEKWIETLELTFALPDTGLDHEGTRVDIARYFMRKGEIEKAAPYANDAACSGASWCLTLAAEVAQTQGDKERARQLIAGDHERYTKSYPWPMQTYFRAKVFQFPEDDPWFIKIKEPAMKSLIKPRNAYINRFHAGFYHCMHGNPAKAEPLFRFVFNKKNDVWYGFPVAMAQQEQGKLDEAKQMLKRMTEKCPHEPKQKDKQIQKDLVAIMLREMDTPSAPNSLMQEMITTYDDVTDAKHYFYFAGKFMANLGHEAEAVQLFYKAVEPNEMVSWMGPLPYLELRDRGLDPFGKYRNEAPPYPATKQINARTGVH